MRLAENHLYLLKELTCIIKLVIICVIIVFIIQRYLFLLVEIQGSSMEPTLFSNDRVVVWQLLYEPQAFHIIVLEHTDGNHHIKRIIGMPGNRVDYINGELIIDGKIIHEPYIQQEPSLNGFMFEDICQFENCAVIPESYFLVMGDNRNRSGDSREYGLIHESQIVGRAVMRFWPLRSFQWNMDANMK